MGYQKIKTGGTNKRKTNQTREQELNNQGSFARAYGGNQIQKPIKLVFRRSEETNKAHAKQERQCCPFQRIVFGFVLWVS